VSERSARLPADTRLGRVRLVVADLARSGRFYQDVLGLVAITAEERHLTLGTGDGEPLIELVEHPGARPVPTRGRLGLFHVALVVPDRAVLGRFVRHATARGVALGAGDHLVSEAFYLSDPDGLGLEVYADRPRSSWEFDRGELRMATLPVDVTSLLAAAGATPWGGMPDGTRVGHLHLQVDDLARANAFYGDGLGLDVTVQSFPGALFLSAGGYHHHLGLNTWAPSARQAGPDDARLLSWEVRLPAAATAAAAGRLTALGGRVVVRADGWEAVDPWDVTLVVSR